MAKEIDPCFGCEERFVGCHGKNEEGNWHCLRWAKVQEKKQASLEETAARREAAKVNRDYKSESRTRMLRRKQRGH